MSYKREIIVIEDMKPMSVNSMTANGPEGRGRWHTMGAKEWIYEMFTKLNTPKTLQSFKNLREMFIPLKHMFHISITIEYPHSVMIAKTTGCISAKTIDCTNFEKPIIDLLFLPKYFDEQPPYGIANLCLDDKYITKCSGEKRVSADQRHRIIIEIDIKPRDF